VVQKLRTNGEWKRNEGETKINIKQTKEYETKNKMTEIG